MTIETLENVNKLESPPKIIASWDSNWCYTESEFAQARSRILARLQMDSEEKNCQMSVWLTPEYTAVLIEGVSPYSESWKQIAWTFWANVDEVWPNNRPVGEGWHATTSACNYLSGLFPRIMVLETKSSFFGRAFGSGRENQKDIELTQWAMRASTPDLLEDFWEWFVVPIPGTEHRLLNFSQQTVNINGVIIPPIIRPTGLATGAGYSFLTVEWLTSNAHRLQIKLVKVITDNGFRITDTLTLEEFQKLYPNLDVRFQENEIATIWFSNTGDRIRGKQLSENAHKFLNEKYPNHKFQVRLIPETTGTDFKGYKVYSHTMTAQQAQENELINYLAVGQYGASEPRRQNM